MARRDVEPLAQTLALAEKIIEQPIKDVSRNTQTHLADLTANFLRGSEKLNTHRKIVEKSRLLTPIAYPTKWDL